MSRWHARLRDRVKRDRALIAATLPAPCHICGLTVTALDAWDCDHDPPLSVAPERALPYPAHAHCNRSRGAQLGNARGLRDW